MHGWLKGDSTSLKAGPAIRAATYLGVNILWLAEGEGPMLSLGNQILVPLGGAVEAPPASSKVEERLLLEGFRVGDRSTRRLMLATAKEAIAIFKRRTGT